MPSHKTLTTAAVDKLKAPKQGQIDHFDRSFPGLALRASCGGRKSWVYVYRVGGTQRRFTIDTYPALSVAGAHDAWRKARDLVQGGRDPAVAAAAPSATDFSGVFDEWLKRDQAGNRSAETVRKKLEKDVLPAWQHRQIAGIGRRDVLNLIDAIVDRGAVIQARRIQAYLHRLFKWAVGRGIIEINPLADLPKPGSERQRDRVLIRSGGSTNPYEELLAVWRAGEQAGYPYGPAVQLLILTGARRQEISGLRWSEISGDIIELDGSRTKNGVKHTIPLSAPARAIIDSLPRVAGSEFLFTNDGATSIASWGRAKARLDEIVDIAPWTIHDLRRTTATGLQKLGTPLQVTEAVLGHTGGSRAGVVGIYQRHDYLAEKRSALEAWGAHVISLIEGRTPSKVLPMTRKRG